jgi:hypothetical protein
MRGRCLAVVAVAAMVGSGCTTLVEASAPNGANHAGYSVPESQGGGPALSGDGRYSVFTAPRTATNPTPEAFRRDAATGTTVRVSSDASGHAVGGDAPAISRDGRYVMFRTTAPLVAADRNLDPANGSTGGDWYLKDMQTGAFELLTLDPTGAQLVPRGSKHLAAAGYVSATGRYVAFQLQVEDGSGGYSSDIYVRDRQAGVTRRVAGGVEVLSGLSGDGLHVGIDEFSTCTLCQPPFPGAAIANWSIGTRYEIPCEAGGRMGMSDDGRYAVVIQTAEQTSCTAGVARYNQYSGAVPEMITPEGSVNQNGGGPNISGVTVSADGQRVAYSTTLRISPDDTDGVSDVYVNTFFQRTQRASLTAAGQPANGDSTNPWLSADGQIVQFDTRATNLLTADGDGQSDTVVVAAIRPFVIGFNGSSQLAPGVPTAIQAVGLGFAPAAVVFSLSPNVTITNPSTVGDGIVRFTATASTSAPSGPVSFLVVSPRSIGVASGTCTDCLQVVRSPT